MKLRSVITLFLVLNLTSQFHAQKRNDTPAAQGSFTIQVLSASSQQEAETMTEQLRAKKLDAYWVRTEVPGQGLRYRVRIGRYTSIADAQTDAASWRRQGVIRRYFLTNWESPDAPEPMSKASNTDVTKEQQSKGVTSSVQKQTSQLNQSQEQQIEASQTTQPAQNSRSDKERNGVGKGVTPEQRLSANKADELLAKGDQFRQAGRKKEALAAFHRALEEVRGASKSKFVFLELFILDRLGQMYLEAGELDKAQENYQAAFHRAKEAGELHFAMTNIRNLEQVAQKRQAQGFRSELVVQAGHTLYNITSVTFAPNGRVFASGSWDGTIKLWEAASGALLRTFVGHGTPVTSVAFAPDGRTVASAGLDGTIKLWETTSGALLQTLADGYTDSVTCVVFSPDGRTLAGGRKDGAVKLWDAASGSLIRTYAGHERNVTSVAFSPNGRMLSASSDEAIILWNVDSGASLRTYAGHRYRATSVTFSPDGRMLASGGADNTVKLWDVIGGTPVRTFSGDGMEVNSIAFAPDGRTLASAYSDCIIKLWDIASGMSIHTLLGHTSWVNSVAYAPDGRTLASASLDNTIKLWDVNSGTLLRACTKTKSNA